MELYSLILFFILIITHALLAWPYDSVVSRASSAVSVTWTPNEINAGDWFYGSYSNTCTGADSIYKACDFIPGTEYRSIAYSYGGEDGDSLFLNKLENNFAVGSHLCHYETYGDPSDTVAGTDCSGFLCWIWNEPRQSTWMLTSNSAYEKPERTNIREGDALVKSGSHAVMVLNACNLEEVLIVESTSAVNGVRYRIIDWEKDGYWAPYQPVRNPKLSGIESVVQLSEIANFTLKVKDHSIHFSEAVESVQLLSLSGRVLSSQKGLDTSLVLPRNLSTGVYMVKGIHPRLGIVSAKVLLN